MWRCSVLSFSEFNGGSAQSSADASPANAECPVRSACDGVRPNERCYGLRPDRRDFRFGNRFTGSRHPRCFDFGHHLRVRRLEPSEEGEASGPRSCDLRFGARLCVASTSNRAHHWSGGHPLLLGLLRRWSELRSSVLGHATESMLRRKYSLGIQPTGVDQWLPLHGVDEVWVFLGSRDLAIWPW